MNKKIYLIILSVLIINLIGISLISASMEWDNDKDYNPITKEVTIRNACIFELCFGEEIATMKLDTPQINKVIPGKDRLVAEFTINNLKDYENVFNDMRFYNKWMDELDRDFIYRYKTWDEKIVPVTYYDNGKIISSKNNTARNPIWNDFDSSNGLLKGEITIGVFADVYEDDYVEWIPTLYGEKIDEWAVWTAALTTDLVLYYNFNSTTELITGDFNLTNTSGGVSPIFTTTGALIGFSGNVSSIAGRTGWNISSNDMLDHYGNETGNGLASYNFWMKPTELATNKWMVYQSNGTTNYGISTSEGVDGSSYRLFGMDLADNVIIDAGGGHLVIGSWTMITLTRNLTSWNLYTNGALLQTGLARNRNFDFGKLIEIGQKSSGAPNNQLHGSYDEMGWWNRTLSSAEVTQLYNGGAGITYNPDLTASPKLSLNYPPVDFQTTLNENRFNCSTSTGAVNISLTINGLINNTVTNTTANQNLSLQKNVTMSDAIYTWGCLASNAVGQTNETRTITITGISFGTHVFNNLTTEGNTEDFTMNFTAATGYQISEANLIFNNTKYVGSFTSSGNLYNATRTINIPTIDSSVNQTVYWSVILETGQTYNSTVGVENVSVLALSIDDCSAQPVLLLNLTQYDEEDRGILKIADNATYEIDIEIFPIGSDNTVLNISKLYNRTDSAPVCISDDLTSGSEYEMDMEIRYSAGLHTTEFYYIQRFSLDNSTLGRNISLYPLKNINAQEFRLRVRDTSYLPIDGALIQIERKYVSDGLFITTEIPKADEGGIASASLQTNDVTYNFKIYDGGTLVSTFNNVLAICQTPLVSTCEIDFNAFQSGISIPDYEEGDDFQFTLGYNDSSRIINTQFEIPSGEPSVILLEVTREDSLGTAGCTDTLTSSSGTLSCTIPNSFGNSTVIAKLYKDGVEQGKGNIKSGQKSKDIFPGVLILLSVLVMITLIGMGVSDNPVVTAIFLFVGVVVLAGINLIQNTGFIGATATILFFAIAIILVIIKAARRS